MNGITNKLERNEFMLEMHLRQPWFTYSVHTGNVPQVDSLKIKKE